MFPDEILYGGAGVPPFFGGEGAPPGFGSDVPASGGSASVPSPRRPGNRQFPLINRNPTDDPRLRSFTDLMQEFFNSLGLRGFIVRDSRLRWSLAPNPWREARDPTADDDATVGVLVGELWINTETGAVWLNTSAAAGVAVWIELTQGGGESGLTGTFTETFS